MHRRRFLAMIGGAVAGPAGLSIAEQRKIPSIGFLSSASRARWTHLVVGFEKGLKELGYVDSYVAAGGLMSYGSSFTEAYREAGLYVARILNGERAGDLPVIQPAKFELAINLGAAKELDISPSAYFLARVDEIIER